MAMRSWRSRGQRIERPHVVQTVGQFHQDDADVGHHGEQHLADAFGLALLARIEVDLAQLGDAVDTARHVVAELVADFLDGGGGVLHDVVQQPGLQADEIHLLSASRWVTCSGWIM